MLCPLSYSLKVRVRSHVQVREFIGRLETSLSYFLGTLDLSFPVFLLLLLLSATLLISFLYYRIFFSLFSMLLKQLIMLLNLKLVSQLELSFIQLIEIELRFLYKSLKSTREGMF